MSSAFIFRDLLPKIPFRITGIDYHQVRGEGKLITTVTFSDGTEILFPGCLEYEDVDNALRRLSDAT